MAVRKPLLYIGLAAILSVLLIELALSDIPAPNHLLYKLGQVYLKLCYSYVSAFIFYLLAVHWPRETRRVRTFRLLNNAIARISLDLSKDLIDALFMCRLKEEERVGLTLDSIQKACSAISPLTIGPDTQFGSGLPYYENYGQFIQLMCTRLKTEVNDLLPLSENIDAKVLESLSTIIQILADHLSPAKYGVHNSDLSSTSYGLYELNNEALKLKKRFVAAHKKYAPEYHYTYRRERSSR